MAELVLPRESTIEFILTNEPSFTKLEYVPTSTLATVPDFLRKDFRVPVVAGTSSSTAFWLCVQEYETYDDLSVVISDVQEKLSEATASLRQRHASWLAAHASSYMVAPTAFGANTAFAAHQIAIRDLQSATNTYWDYKFLLRDLEGPIPSYAGDLTVALEAHREETNARLTVVEGDVRSMKDTLSELRDLLLKGGSHTDHRREGGPRADKRRAPPLATKPAKKPALNLPPKALAEEAAKWAKKGLAEALFHRRNSDGRCINCGVHEHDTASCPHPDVVLPPSKR
eukprot:jgi/Botrbrau1/18969/Bobra.0100s0006.1